MSASVRPILFQRGQLWGKMKSSPFITSGQNLNLKKCCDFCVNFRRHFCGTTSVPVPVIASGSTTSLLKDKFCEEFSHAKTLSTTQIVRQSPADDYLDVKDKDVYDVLANDMQVHFDFLTVEEEQSILDEVDKYMKRLRYEFDHWDNAIHGFRETERKSWNEANMKILDRVRQLAFCAGVSPLAYVHVLDVAKEGYIKPHVDAVRFCGDTIAGLSLLSPCVMRFALEADASQFGDVYLPRRSLYVMRGRARYEFTHALLQESESYFKQRAVPRDRRLSVICRNEPRPEDQS